MNPLVSVIIPVYKVEKYLNQCVDSVLAQTYQNIEIILVDDGSPDNSGAICDDYATKDNRIKVIHKENGGLSSARNAGVDAANGEYIQFIDSDDFLCENTCIEKLAKKVQEDNYDFVLFNTAKWYMEENKYINQGRYDINIFCGEKSQIFKYMVKTHKPVGTAINKMIKRSTILNHDVYFKEGILAEDIDWSIRLFRASEKMTAVNETLYIYRKDNPDSITSNVNDQMIWNLYHTIQEQAKVAINQESAFEKAVLSFIAYIYGTLFYNIARHNESEKFSEVTEYDWLFRYAIDKRTKLVRIIYTIFSFKIGIKIIAAIKNLRKRV